jgi:hypothetical protein
MDFKFYLFGAPLPNGFALYPFDSKLTDYFKAFDNGSKENVKLTVHRMASGRVSYSYLRYHFLSNGNQTGGFFGMSVVFNSQYCKDAEGLYELFDTVYTDVILRNEILLKAIVGNPAGSPQAKYLVDTFAEAEDEVKRIESIVRKNLLTHFADDMFPVTALPPVAPNNAGLIKQLNDKSVESTFLPALKQYGWVVLSPEYSNVDNLALSPEKTTGRSKETEKELIPKKLGNKKSTSKINKQRSIGIVLILAIVIILGWLGFQYKPFSARPHATETSAVTLPAETKSKETKPKEEKTEPAIVPEKEENDKSNQTAIKQLRNKAKDALKVKEGNTSQPTPTTATTNEKITIHVIKGNIQLKADKGVIVISKNDEIKVTAKQGNTACSGGVWTYNIPNIDIDNTMANPLTVKANSETTHTLVKLLYKDNNGKELASIQIKIM